MTSYEAVKKAINRQDPDYVPIMLFRAEFDRSDIVTVDVGKFWEGEDKDLSEWGFKWESFNDTVGQPLDWIIKEWSDFENFKVPDPYDVTRFDGMKEAKDRYGEDKYYLANLVLSGFHVVAGIRGFANSLEDFYLERENIEKLIDMVFDYEKKIIEQAASYGFHGIGFFDDWGSQNGMFISPELWREVFKPRYKALFDCAHEHGLDIFFHCCGYFYDIIGDFIEVGVDMLEIAQPNLYDIPKLGRDFGGKTCFVMPVSYQTTSLSGTKEDIYSEVQEFIDHLGCYNGGLIGYIEKYPSIGMSEENFEYCVNAFLELGGKKV